ncbi:MAG: class I SAM-dependent methyltransferase [Chromatiales bacterium]|nr:class I SAM-dependent methyltransferase [Chromatiales bacterium]
MPRATLERMNVADPGAAGAAVDWSSRAGFACRLCDCTDLRLFYTLGNDRRFRYYRCTRCGLANYDLSGGTDQTQYTSVRLDPRDDLAQGNRDNDESFSFLRRHVPVPGRLIDIGCGNGRLLWQAKQAGWQVKGLELDRATADYAAQVVGCEVESRDFLAADPLPGDREAFDAVVLRHVLEHLPYPRLAMEKINALLRPGGLLLVEIPNIDGWSKRWVRLITRTGLHRRRFPPDLVPGHCCEYSRRSFTALLEHTGYELLRWETYSKKRLANAFLARFPIGTKARALARRLPA